VPRLLRKANLIHDRDPPFTDEFGDILRGAGVKCLKLPAHGPDVNAYAERFVLSPATGAAAKSCRQAP
jgi:hypothetical protein